MIDEISLFLSEAILKIEILFLINLIRKSFLSDDYFNIISSIMIILILILSHYLDLCSNA